MLKSFGHLRFDDAAIKMGATDIFIAILMASLTKMAAKPQGCLHLDEATWLLFDGDKLRSMRKGPTHPHQETSPYGIRLSHRLWTFVPFSLKQTPVLG